MEIFDDSIEGGSNTRCRSFLMASASKSMTPEAAETAIYADLEEIVQAHFGLSRQGSRMGCYLLRRVEVLGTGAGPDGVDIPIDFEETARDLNSRGGISSSCRPSARGEVVDDGLVLTWTLTPSSRGARLDSTHIGASPRVLNHPPRLEAERIHSPKVFDLAVGVPLS